MQQLIKHLERAEQLASQYTGGYSSQFMSAEEFHQALKNAIAELKHGKTDILQDLWYWFAPTCDWDDLIGNEGEDLGNTIFYLLNL